jgi:DNA-binding IclR family transcriptional regulator
VRIRILLLLAGETCCFTGELTEIIPMAQSTISQHLKALLEAGLIQGEIDPPKVRYCIDRQNWERASNCWRFFLPEAATVLGMISGLLARKGAFRSMQELLYRLTDFGRAPAVSRREPP